MKNTGENEMIEITIKLDKYEELFMIKCDEKLSNIKNTLTENELEHLRNMQQVIYWKVSNELRRKNAKL